MPRYKNIDMVSVKCWSPGRYRTNCRVDLTDETGHDYTYPTIGTDVTLEGFDGISVSYPWVQTMGLDRDEVAITERDSETFSGNVIKDIKVIKY